MLPSKPIPALQQVGTGMVPYTKIANLGMGIKICRLWWELHMLVGHHPSFTPIGCLLTGAEHHTIPYQFKIFQLKT